MGLGAQRCSSHYVPCGALMSFLNVLDWRTTKKHYNARVAVYRRLLQLHANRDVDDFAELSLGISDPVGNYSADEHTLGPKIVSLNLNAHRRVFDVAADFMALVKGRGVPEIIRELAMSHLKIGIGSEISCLVNPTVCWVANTRTIWTHLVFKHNSLALANEELKLYRDDDISSEMAYQKWRAIHRSVEKSMREIADEGAILAARAKVKPGKITFLWADAIASALYGWHHD